MLTGGLSPCEHDLLPFCCNFATTTCQFVKVFRLLSTIYKDNGFATRFEIIELIICRLADDSLSLQCELKTSIRYEK